MTINNLAIFHFVDPVARFRNCRIVGHQKQSFPSAMDKIPEQLERSL